MLSSRQVTAHRNPDSYVPPSERPSNQEMTVYQEGYSVHRNKSRNQLLVGSARLANWKRGIVLWCVFLISMATAPQAVASDDINFCESHETPPDVVVSLPEDDAPKSLSEEVVTDLYAFVGNFQTLAGHRYTFQLIFALFEGTTIFATASVTDVDNQIFRHKAWASLGIPYEETENSYDLSVPDGPLSGGSPRAIGANGNAWLEMEVDGVTVELVLTSLKNPAYFFHNGFGSFVDPATGQDVGSRFFFGRTKNLALGTIKQNGLTQPVFGEAWADTHHLIALQGDIVNTGYFIRLDNGEEIMAYDFRMRQTGDQVFRSATLVGAPSACEYEELAPEDFIMTSSGAYTSPHSGNVYPTSFQLEIPSRDLELTLTPDMEDQEFYNLLGFFPPTWSGQATVEGTRNGVPVRGHASVDVYVGPQD